MEDVVRHFKALSDRNRLRILKLLQTRPSLCVCEITEVLGCSTPTVSNHLGILSEAGLVDSEKDGRWVHYRLVREPKSPEAASLLPLLQYWMSEDDQVRADRAKLKTVSRDLLCKP